MTQGQPRRMERISKRKIHFAPFERQAKAIARPFNVVVRYPRVTVCPVTGIENVPRPYDTDVVIQRRDGGLAKDRIARARP